MAGMPSFGGPPDRAASRRSSPAIGSGRRWSAVGGAEPALGVPAVVGAGDDPSAVAVSPPPEAGRPRQPAVAASPAAARKARLEGVGVMAEGSADAG